MPSVTHQALVELFRARPALAPELLTSLLAVAMPPHATATVGEAALDQLVPTEFRADLVVELRDAPAERVLGAIVVEVQVGRDEEKPWTWPVYLTALRARLRAPVWLLVVTPSAEIAAWAATPLVLAPGTGALHPLVLGPDAVPAVTDPALALEHPELALLSAVAHAHEPVAADIVEALPLAFARLDQGTMDGYLAMLKKALPRATWDHLEVLVMQQRVSFANVPISPAIDRVRDQARTEGRTEGRAEGLTQGEAVGEARAILTLLDARGIAVSEAVRARILACTDLATLDRWVRRAATARTASAVVRLPRASR